jgi:serine/threonine protein kinase/Tol biopolymer transport system component
MDRQRWVRIDEVFQATLEMAAEERAVYLDRACAGDADLRARVERLLALDRQTLSLIERPVSDLAPDVIALEPELRAGERLGEYEVLGLLGAGGMGEVYLARDARLGRKVALKLLPADFASSAERLGRFRTEARAASALNHPNIVTVYEVGSSDDRQYIATEYIEGETLRERLAAGPMEVGEAVDVATQMASALAVAHAAGIVHRDVKPENVMVRRDGIVKVLDFGVAKLGEGASDGEAGDRWQARPTATQAGAVVGTASYMSPEQARGLDVDSRSDIFSLGVVMCEMVAGYAPFDGATSSDLIEALTTDEPTSLKHFSPDVPDELERIIDRAVSKDREARYQDLRSMLDDLKRLKQRLEIGDQLPERRGDGGAAAATATNPPAAARTADGRAISTGDADALPTSHAREQRTGRLGRNKVTSAAVVVALLGAAGGMIYSTGELSRNKRAAFQETKITQIPGTKDSFYGAISPDGNYLAYLVPDPDKAGIWIKKLSTNEDTPLVAPGQVGFVWLIFAPNSTDVYFARGEDEHATLYDAAIAGGEPTKVLEDVAGPVTFSPDARQIAFVRVTEGATAIILASADGSEQRELARHKYPEFFNPMAPAWSPDGSVIACTAGSMQGEGYGYVAEVQVENGTERSLYRSQPGGEVDQIAWLSDGSGLVMVATDEHNGTYQLWNLSYPAGDLRKVTNDLNSYSRLSVTADSKSLVTVRNQLRTSIWKSPPGDAGPAEQVTDEGKIAFDMRQICWSPDDRIVFPGAGREISTMNADGTGLKQLTTDGHPKGWPSASPDGRYIVFSSRGDDARHIWRVDADGRNLTQLTVGTGEVEPSCTPDGWVIYTSSPPNEPRLFKVPIGGGPPLQLTDQPSQSPKVSPDGKLIAFRHKDASANRWSIAIIPCEGGPPLRIPAIAPTPNFGWSPDGRALDYIVSRKGVSNIWSQPIDGGPPRQVTNFDSLTMWGFDWSRDGTLVCSRGFETSDLVLITDSR